MRKTNQGFTMVELIVVITILGILAAVALPRFTNMQRDARIAKLSAARGAVASASAQIYGAAIARQGQTQPNCPVNAGAGTNPPTLDAAGSGSVCTDKGRVQVTLLYPTANLGGIAAAAGLAEPAGTTMVASDLTREGYGAAGELGSLTIQVTGGSAAAKCSFTYTEPTVLGGGAVVGVINTTGC